MYALYLSKLKDYLSESADGPNRSLKHVMDRPNLHIMATGHFPQRPSIHPLCNNL